MGLISPAVMSQVNRNSSHGNSPGDNGWDIYKRYSNFIDLSEVLKPYFQAEGIPPPKLPPRIANKSDSRRNLNLTQRKNHLQVYLRQVILALIERPPAPLLIFLGLHEQSQLGFFGSSQIYQMTDLNLR